MFRSSNIDSTVGTAIPGALAELVMPVRGMTCGSCARRVHVALESVPGVMDARVELAQGRAIVCFDPSRTTVEFLREAVEAAGYETGEPIVGVVDSTTADAGRTAHPVAAGPSLRWPIVFGFCGSAMLMVLYVGLVTLAQGFDHAAELLLGDWYLVVPIALGFGIQLGLFVYMRISLLLRKGTGSATALAGAGTGTSSVAMLACCAHHLTDLLPFLGLSGAALFLSDYRQPLMLMGIATNLVGIGVMVRAIRRMGPPMRSA
jgi:copper chaperone CopZ